MNFLLKVKNLREDYITYFEKLSFNYGNILYYMLVTNIYYEWSEKYS